MRQLTTKLFDVAESEGLRYYGDGGTIHNTRHVNVEIHEGKVVAVWFRCAALPFTEHQADDDRAQDMRRMYQSEQPRLITGIVFKDPRGVSK